MPGFQGLMLKGSENEACKKKLMDTSSHKLKEINHIQSIEKGGSQHLFLILDKSKLDSTHIDCLQ